VAAAKPAQKTAGMVSVLGLDSAGGSCSAAVLGEGRVLARRFAAMERGQAEALMPMVAAVLAEARRPIASLDLIAVTIGPGAFTGLRIGLAAARGLALASALPVLGVSSFAAVAARVPDVVRRARPLVVALESKRAELYLQLFGPDAALWDDGVLIAPILAAARLPSGSLSLAGDAAIRLAAALPGRDLVLAEGPGFADAADVARLAARAWQAGSKPPLPRPLYLRAPDTTQPRAGVIER
jgi:tRNA threonylcarbamoyladenosine biosynthesis protein TsaB